MDSLGEFLAEREILGQRVGACLESPLMMSPVVNEMRRFKNILCVIELGAANEPALEKAVALAENNQAKLMVVDVVPRLPAFMSMLDGGPLSRGQQSAMLREHEARIAALIEPYLQRHDIQHKVLLGTSFLEIIRVVLRNGHDLVIKCPESPSWLDRFLSGDDMHLLRKCPCPVWLVKPRAPSTYQRIIAAVDLDDRYMPEELDTRHRMNVQILEMASSLSVSESAELHVVHAWQSIGELVSAFMMSPEGSEEDMVANSEQERRQNQWLLDDFLNSLKIDNHALRDALNYLHPKTHVLEGSARKEIPILAKQLGVDCIVMGTVARTGIPGFIMGNTAETILAQIDCSVLAIKPQGFETPVTLED
jgi:nucleotide-binding universal stress UspA family protein